MNDIDKIHSEILAHHRCEARYRESIHIHEQYQGKTVWQGNVEVFDLIEHPETKLCYAWVYHDTNKRPHVVTVLGVPPVSSPRSAIRAAINLEPST